MLEDSRSNSTYTIGKVYRSVIAIKTIVAVETDVAIVAVRTNMKTKFSTISIPITSIFTE